LTQIDEPQLVKRLRWTAIVLVAFGAALTLAAQPSRFWSLPKTAIRFDGLPIHNTTNPMFDFFLGHGWLAYLAGVGLYGAIIWLLPTVLPKRLAMVTELAVILGLSYSKSNWVVVRWHTGTAGAEFYIAGVALVLTLAVLPVVHDREGEGLRRLCWLMTLTTTVDGAFTLNGQPASYWRDTLTVHEANPLAKFFLETGWWAYATYIVALITVPWFLSMRVSRGTGWVIVLGMTLGGLFGGSNWLFYEWRLGLQAPILYSLVLSLMIVWLLLKGNQAAKPGERPNDGLAECRLWQC
jgi:hypothetical protein